MTDAKNGIILMHLRVRGLMIIRSGFAMQLFINIYAPISIMYYVVF